jgi:hypothetical protein
MNSYTKQLANELDNCGKMSMFEISVVNGDGEQDWIACNISFEGDSIVAVRDNVSSQERDSKFHIGINKVPVDPCLSLDEHLQVLHEIVLDSINNGDLWTLAE